MRITQETKALITIIEAILEKEIQGQLCPNTVWELQVLCKELKEELK